MGKKEAPTLSLVLDAMARWLEQHRNEPMQCVKLFELLLRRSKEEAVSGEFCARIVAIVERRARERKELPAETVKRVFGTDNPELVYIELGKRDRGIASTGGGHEE
jgi:hypothetical protein